MISWKPRPLWAWSIHKRCVKVLTLENYMPVVLLPCPFCGSAAQIGRIGSGRSSCIVSCENCGATLESNEIGAGYHWNQRAKVTEALKPSHNSARDEICANIIETDSPCDYCKADGDDGDSSPCHGCGGCAHFIGRKLRPIA